MLSPFLQKLLFVNQFEVNQGKITLLGDRKIMLDASIILALQETDETKAYDMAKKIGFENISGAVEHVKVYGAIKNAMIKELAVLGEKIGETDEGTIKTLENFFNLYGLGLMSIQNIDNENKSALIEVKDSAIADSWLTSKKAKSKDTACTLTAGVLAGMFSYIFGKDIDCREQKCKAQGEDSCVFKVA
jgi:predicted hydrocarbon binding protein